jgi:uncharacterized protein
MSDIDSESQNNAKFHLACPKDGQPMERVAVSSFNIDRCTACRAIWLDVKELQMLIEYYRKHADQLDAKGAAGPKRNVNATADTVCPRDGARLINMVDKKQTHIKYLGCSTCGGILLDAGELTDMVHFTFGERVKSFFKS